MTEEVKPINSEGYWDGRFNSDWEVLEGPRQSRFFSRVALDLLPPWLLEQIGSRELTLADWGCAQGDGTALLAEEIPRARVTGIDFSPVAIRQARERYPQLTFETEDWLSGTPSPGRFDVVFSSNTLEHFHDPASVLQALCAKADKAVVLALPYREMERIDEHFFTFTAENIPAYLPGGFELTWARVVECTRLRDPLWDGEQVVLVYGRSEWLASLGLCLADRRTEQDDPAGGAAAQTVIAEWRAAAADLQQQLDEQRRKAEESERQHRKQLDALNGELQRMSAWAQTMDRGPILYALKRYAYGAAKAAYRTLPLSPATKQRGRSALSRLAGTARRSLRPTVTEVVNPLADITLQVDSSQYLPERDVFVFSVIDWHFRIQRPQHIAKGFARLGRRVFFISSSFLDSDEPGYALERLDPELELYLVRLHVSGAPAVYFAQPTAQAQNMIEQGLARLIGGFGATSSVSVLQHPYWWRTALRLPNSLRVYDCMDHHEGFGNVPQELIDLEKEMLQRSDLVVVTSSWLEGIAARENRNVAVVRNAGEYAHFADRPQEVFRDPNGRRVIGYYGAIAEWFDIELVRAIALAHPDCLVLLVGNDTVEAGKKLADLRNVQFTGEVPYDRLPYYLHGFDVCLLPFKVIPLTLATNPVKIYEYLSAGKPVVAVDLPEIAQFGQLVTKAGSREAFVAAVGEVLSQPQSAELVKARRVFAREQTWDHRVRAMAQAVRDLPLPRISVVVLTYNNLELTKACLDSVLRESDYPALELIVVDNASGDGTPEYLRAFQQQHPEAKVILNEQNLGFAAGNNIGLAAATGEYLVILNNDTVVTRGWAMTLMRHLQSSPQIALAGPMTNNIGNEARIETTYAVISGMKPQALRYTLTHMGQHFPIRTAAFFCVMFPRSTYEACGPLCEEYGLGFFEDDDYCRCIEAQGLQSVCAEDVFVHHHLSASFNKLPSKSRQELFERNKAIYEAKWGRWQPHSYKRDGQLPA